jgi:ribonuclease P protein component
MTLLAVPNCLSVSRLGIIASKKNYPRAVDRNYLKRFIRESFRQQRIASKTFDFVVIFRRDFLTVQQEERSNQAKKLWQRFHFVSKKQSSF